MTGMPAIVELIPQPYPPNWPDCDPEDPTPPPTTEELIGEQSRPLPLDNEG